MKKFYLLVVIGVFCYTQSKAQFEYGTTVLSGSSSFSFASTSAKYKGDGMTVEGGNTTTLEFSPAVGYFFADGFAVGLNIQYAYTKAEESKSNSFSVGPFAKYYFNINSPNVYPFLQSELLFGSQTADYFGEGQFKSSTSGFGLGGGIAVLLNEKVALEIGAGYANVTFKSKKFDYKVANSGIAISTGISIFF